MKTSVQWRMSTAASACFALMVACTGQIGDRPSSVPSCSSVRASHMPSPLGPPIVSLCTALSSAEVVKVITNCGLAKAGGLEGLHPAFRLPVRNTGIRATKQALTNDVPSRFS